MRANHSKICKNVLCVLPLLLMWAPVLLQPTDGLQLRMVNLPPRKLLIIGVGRVGGEVMRQASESQWFDSVQGISPRSPNNNNQSDDRSVAWDDADCIADCTKAANTCTHVLVTLPPNVGYTACDAIVREMGRPGNNSSSSSSLWLGILSTTGVYGHHDGAWVSEDSVCHSSTTSSSAYLDYEKQWIHRVRHHFCDQSSYRLRIFRCAGIYGPNASALHTVMRKGLTDGIEDTSSKSNQTDKNVTNRIHITDLAAAVLSSMMLLHSTNATTNSRDSKVRIYNLADDLPESRTVVLSYAADVLRKNGISIGTQQRTVVTTAIHQERRPNKRSLRRQLERKKVDNNRMKDELIPRLRYPTYKEGLNAVMLSNRTQW